MTRSHAQARHAQRSDPPHLRGREALQISPGATGTRTHGGKISGEKPQQTGPGFNRTSAHPGGPRTRNTRAGRAHDTQAQPPRSAAPTGCTPPPGGRKFWAPLLYAPRPQKCENFSPISKPHATPTGCARAHGPHYTQKEGPTGAIFSPIRWRLYHDTYKGNPGKMLRLLRRQHKRGAAMPCCKLPLAPL